MKYIKGFDGLRAISIILVLIQHLGLYHIIEGIPFLERNFNLYSGSTGVMIFFTISGFLISNILINEKRSTGSIKLKNFFVRRFLRLLPPLVVFFSIILILMQVGLLPQHYTSVFISFFYLYNFIPSYYDTIELGHTWSLAVEEQFYLFWPFVIRGVKNTKKIILFCLGIVALCLVWKSYNNFPVMYQGNLYQLKELFAVDQWFIPACLPIMIGALSSVILFAYPVKMEQLFYRSYVILVASFVFYSSQLFFPFYNESLVSICQPVGIVLLLLWIYFNQDAFLVKLLEFKPLAFVGKISYGIYVYQGLYLTTGPSGKLFIQQFPQNIVLVFATAIGSYYLIEKKILRLKDRFTSVPKQ